MISEGAETLCFLWVLTVCAQVFPKCCVKGLSKYTGTFNPATCVFEEIILETTTKFTRSKIHSFVKFSGKLASRSINSGSQWMSFFLIKREGEKKKKGERASLDTKVTFLLSLQVWICPQPGVCYYFIYWYWDRSRFRLNSRLQMVFRRWSRLQPWDLCMAVSPSTPYI